MRTYPVKPDVSGHDCAHCDAPLKRRRINSRLEDYSVYLRRKYCDRRCMSLGFVKDAPSSSDAYHWRARKLRGKSCEKCGTTKRRLDAHHADGNEQNNSPGNVQTLCDSCHASHHHHARRAGWTVTGRAR